MRAWSSAVATRTLVLVVVGTAVLLAGGVALGGWVLHNRHERTVTEAQDQLHPAMGQLAQIQGAIADARVACLMGDQFAQFYADADRRASSGLTALRQLVADFAPIGTAVAALDNSSARWLLAVAPGQTATPCTAISATTPFSPAPSVPPAVSVDTLYAAVHSDAGRVSTLLNREMTRDLDAADTSDRDVLMFVLALAVLLIAVAAFSTFLLTRHFLTPVAVLQERLRLVAGVPDEDTVAPFTGGRVARLAREADTVLERLAVSQQQARRGREALEQNGPAVAGLRRILAARDGAGPGVEVRARLVAAQGLLSGDYLGSLALPDASTAVLVGDVSGHGVQAGLLAVRLKSVIETVLRSGLDLAAATVAAWHTLPRDEEYFATLVVARIDPEEGTVSWVNAGHPEPFLRRADGTVERLAPTGPLVHPFLVPTTGTWETRTVPFATGDLLVLVTDGLTEARPAAGGQEMGDARVAEVLARLHRPAPTQAVRVLHAAARDHGIDWDRDDVTIVAAARTPGSGAPGGAPA